jgi:hypothetical protein
VALQCLVWRQVFLVALQCLVASGVFGGVTVFGGVRVLNSGISH